MIINAPPEIDEEILGVVCGTRFVHADCFDSDDACIAAIENEDNNVVVMRDDAWASDVGLCVECGGIATEDPL